MTAWRHSIRSPRSSSPQTIYGQTSSKGEGDMNLLAVTALCLALLVSGADAVGKSALLLIRPRANKLWSTVGNITGCWCFDCVRVHSQLGMEWEEKTGCVRNVEMGRWKTLTILWLDANMWRKTGWGWKDWWTGWKLGDKEKVVVVMDRVCRDEAVARVVEKIVETAVCSICPNPPPLTLTWATFCIDHQGQL